MPTSNSGNSESIEDANRLELSLAELNRWVGRCEAVVLLLEREATRMPTDGDLDVQCSLLYGSPAHAMLYELRALAAKPNDNSPGIARLVMPIVEKEFAASHVRGCELVERVKRALVVADLYELSAWAELGEIKQDIEWLRGAIARWREEDVGARAPSPP